MKKVLSHGLFELRAIMRNGEQALLNLLLPIASLIVLAKVPVPGAYETMSPEMAYASALGLGLASIGFTSQAIATAFDRRWGVMRMLATTPLGPRGLFAGKLLAVGTVGLIAAVILGVIAIVLGADISLAGILWGLLAGALGLAAFLALGLLVGGTLKPEAVLAVANLLWVGMATGGGLLIPTGRLGWWGRIVEFTPPGALGEALRNGPSTQSLLHLGVLAAWTLVGTALTARYFQWDSR